MFKVSTEVSSWNDEIYNIYKFTIFERYKNLSLKNLSLKSVNYNSYYLENFGYYYLE